MKPGEKVDVLVPLGNGFDIQKGKKYCLIGGGIGVPPMLYTAKQCDSPVAITGFRDESLVILQDDFKSAGAETVLVTDNGSAGAKGFVTDILPDACTHYYACGPEPMLRAVYRAVPGDGQLSFEERMGCGFGACMGCSCRTITGYKRICKDGPVLDMDEIVW